MKLSHISELTEKEEQTCVANCFLAPFDSSLSGIWNAMEKTLLFGGMYLKVAPFTH